MTIIESSNPDMAFNAVVSGFKNQDTMNYLKSNYESFVNSGVNLGGNFINIVKDTYNKFNNSTVINNIKRTLAQSSGFVSNDIVYTVDEHNIGRAGELMKRYVMSEPTMFNMYENFQCSGYDDSWYNNEPEIITPELRNDYLDVIDGVLRFDDEGRGIVSHVYKTEDNPLSIDERLILSDTYVLINRMINEDLDPSDPYGE